MLSKKKRQIILIVLSILIGSFICYGIISSGYESTEDAAIDAHIAAIIPKVPGYISKINVSNNQKVIAGDVLLQIDTADYQIALDKAQAELELAQISLDYSLQARDSDRGASPSGANSARLNVTQAEANWEKSMANLGRYREMKKLSGSHKYIADAIAQEKATRLILNDAKASLKAAEMAPKHLAGEESDVQNAEARVKIARANFDQAIENLKSTTITAPLDGYITKLHVEEGVYVQTGQEMFAVVGDKYWVVANFKETQLAKIRVGQMVDIKIDAYPATTYHGKIDSMQAGTGARFSVFPPENASGNFVKVVQRVPVKILFDSQPDAALHIVPGISVEPSVHLK